MHPSRHDERGSSLTMSLFLVFVLIGVSSSVLSTSLHRYAAVRQEFEQERALQMAEVGLDAAFYEIQNEVDLADDGIGVTSGAGSNGTFQVSITPAFAGQGEYTLRSVGRFQGMPVALELVVESKRDLDFGVFGDTDVVVSGDFLVDSYVSALGTYASQMTGKYAGSEGHIASNGVIQVTGSAWVNGDVKPGPGGSFSGDPSTIEGTVAPSATTYEFPTPVYSPPIASSGSLSGTVSLGSGTYRYSTVSLQSSDVVSLSGDVKLYVDGAFAVSGSASINIAPGSQVTIYHGGSNVELGGKGIVNGSMDPTMLTVISSSTANVQISGTAALYAMVYAPSTVLELSGMADLYGAFIGDQVNMSGTAAVHHDESVRLPVDVDLGFRVRAARRLANPDASSSGGSPSGPTNGIL